MGESAWDNKMDSNSSPRHHFLANAKENNLSNFCCIFWKTMASFSRSLIGKALVLLTVSAITYGGEMKHNEIDSSRACACTWTTVADYEGRLQHSHDSNDILKRLLASDGVEEDRVKKLEKLAKKLAYAMPYQQQYQTAMEQGLPPTMYQQQVEDDGGQRTPFSMPSRGGLGGYAPYGFGNNMNAMVQRRQMEDLIRQIVRQEQVEG
eukprot:scpid88025/ scgid14618/ 